MRMKNLLLLSALALGAAARAENAAEAPLPNTCPCSSPRFAAKTEKARAVAEYWSARRSYETVNTVNGLALIFGVMAQSPKMIQDVQNANTGLNAREEYLRARARAEDLGGLRVVSRGGKDLVYVQLEPGVDYELRSSRP